MTKTNIALWAALVFAISPFSSLRSDTIFAIDSDSMEVGQPPKEFIVNSADNTEITVAERPDEVSPAARVIVLGSSEGGMGKYSGIKKKIPDGIKRCTVSFKFQIEKAAEENSNVDIWIGFQNVEEVSKPLTYIRCRGGEKRVSLVPGFTIFDGTSFQKTDIGYIDSNKWFKIVVSIDLEKQVWKYSITDTDASSGMTAEASGLPLLEKATSLQYFSISAIAAGGRISMSDFKMTDD